MFPDVGEYPFVDELFGSHAREPQSYEPISRQDLEDLRPILRDSADLDELLRRINHLVDLCHLKADGTEMAHPRTSLVGALERMIGTAGSMTTILDSLADNGIVSKLICFLSSF